MNIWDDSMLSLQPTSLQTLTPLDWNKQHCLHTLWSLARAHIAGNYWERTNLVDKSITYCDTHAVSFAFVDVGPVLIQSNVAVLNLWNHHQENGVLQTVVPSHGLISNPQYQRDNYCWLKSFTSWGVCILIVWSQISAIRPASKTPGLMFYNSFTVSGFLVPRLREKHTSQTLKIQGGLVGPCRKKVVMKRKKYSTNHCYVECCHIKINYFSLLMHVVYQDCGTVIWCTQNEASSLIGRTNHSLFTVYKHLEAKTVACPHRHCPNHNSKPTWQSRGKTLASEGMDVAVLLSMSTSA